MSRLAEGDTCCLHLGEESGVVIELNLHLL
jgi:hypothetical protein